MKRTILALALLVALVLPGMAKAEGTGMYLAPKFLMTIQETGTIERSGMGGVDEYSQFTLGGALAAGYDFWPQYLVPLRVELEYALRGNSEKSWGSNWGSVDCTWNSSTLFANLYYDFRNDSAFVPYIGAGIGMSFNYLGFDLHRGGSAVSRDESTTNFAWNVAVLTTTNSCWACASLSKAHYPRFEKAAPSGAAFFVFGQGRGSVRGLSPGIREPQTGRDGLVKNRDGRHCGLFLTKRRKQPMNHNSVCAGRARVICRHVLRQGGQGLSV